MRFVASRQPVRRRAARCRRALGVVGFAVAAVVAVALTAAPAFADQLKAAGDGGHVWIIDPQDDGEAFSLWYRANTDQPDDQLSPVQALNGTVEKGGYAAADGRIWLVLSKTHQMRYLQAKKDPAGRRMFEIVVAPSLPSGVAVRSLAANRRGPWALVRLEDAKTLKAIDDTASENDQDAKDKTPTSKTETPDNGKDKDDGNNKANDKSPDAKDAADDKDQAKDKDGAKDGAKDNGKAAAANNQSTAGGAFKADRLLQMHRDGWKPVPLPGDWPAGAPAWIVMRDTADDRPTLVTVPPGGEHRVRWYVWQPSTDDGNKDSATPAGEWIRHEQDVGFRLTVAPLAVQKQLIIAERLNRENEIAFRLHVLRDQQVTEIGEISLEGADRDAALVPVDATIALLAATEDDQYEWRQITLRGEVDEGVTRLHPQQPSYGELWNLIVFIVPIVIATPVLIIMWKREPAIQKLELPESLRLTDFTERLIAGMVDLTPCVIIAALVTDVNINELLFGAHWPGRAINFEQMLPGVITIGIFVGHTFLSEVFTGKTLGKLMVGVRVTNMKGKPADIWQTLARNIFKSMDLILPPLLIFAILSPNKQRLGDMVARTVVVSGGDSSGEEKKEDGEKEEDEEGDERDDGDEDKSREDVSRFVGRDDETRGEDAGEQKREEEQEDRRRF